MIFPAFSRLTLLPGLMVSAGLASCHNPFSDDGAKPSEFVWRTVITEPDSGGWGGLPAVADGRVFVAAGRDIVAFDSRTGAILWRTRVGFGVNPSAVAPNILVRDSRLFLSGVAAVFSLDVATGAIRWQFPTPVQTDRSESSVDDLAMYVGTRNHKVYALDLNDGHPFWTVDLGSDWQYLGIVEGTAVSGDTVYTVLNRFLNSNGLYRSGVIVALDRRSGRELLRYESAGTQHDARGAPAIAGRLLVVSDEAGTSFFAVDRFTGQEVWRVQGDPGYFGPNTSPVAVGNTVYVASSDTFIWAVDLQTGNLRWRTKSAGSYHGTAVCGGKVFGNNQAIDILDQGTGMLLRTVLTLRGREFPDSQFATDGERVYVTGTIAAYAIAC